MRPLPPKVIHRDRQGRWGVNGASECLLRTERTSEAAVRWTDPVRACHFASSLAVSVSCVGPLNDATFPS